MAVWIVVGVLGAGVAVTAALARRREVEPTVREFADFRDAIGRQVAGVRGETTAVRRHLDPPADPVPPGPGSEPA
jgi:hypothetical protein